MIEQLKEQYPNAEVTELTQAEWDDHFSLTKDSYFDDVNKSIADVEDRASDALNERLQQDYDDLMNGTPAPDNYWLTGGKA